MALQQVSSPKIKAQMAAAVRSYQAEAIHVANMLSGLEARMLIVVGVSKRCAARRDAARAGRWRAPTAWWPAAKAPTRTAARPFVDVDARACAC